MASRTFAAGIRFFNVEGVPVKISLAVDGELGVFAFDPAARFFPLNSVIQNGVEISREAFDEMVLEFRELEELRRREFGDSIEGTPPKILTDDEKAWWEAHGGRKDETHRNANNNGRTRPEEN